MHVCLRSFSQALSIFIYNSFWNEGKFLVHRHNFDRRCSILKNELTNLNTSFHSEHTRAFYSAPKVAHIQKDDYSSDRGYFFSNSINSIIAVLIYFLGALTILEISWQLLYVILLPTTDDDFPTLVLEKQAQWHQFGTHLWNGQQWTRSMW
jgi:hypothetical protein